MANISDMQTQFKVDVYLKDGTSTKTTYSYENDNTAGDNSEAKVERFVIGSGTADYTVDIGNMASFDSILIIFSEAVDKVTFSTLVDDHDMGQEVVILAEDGLSSETIIHIDASSTSSDTLPL